MDRDFQRQRVYDWEQRVVDPRDTAARIPYERAQMTVDAIWLAAGLLYPPRVSELHPNNRKWAGKANRMDVLLPAGRPSRDRVIIHEVAHSMTMTVDGQGDAHGPKFLWAYMVLLDRHLKIPMPLLMYTAREAGLQFEVGARLAVLDAA